MMPRRLKEPEAENVRLRRGVSDLPLKKLVLKEAVSENLRPTRRQDRVKHAVVGLGVSERFACKVIYETCAREVVGR